MAIPDGRRLTLCISSQAGCALQCAFCATGAMGFARNLGAWEIAGQVRELALLDPPLRATNVVFMGMGAAHELGPCARSAHRAERSGRARHSARGTLPSPPSAIPPGIQALAARPKQFRLAISIHAPTDALRRDLMPINTKYPLADVIAAASAFTRRVTFEYVLLGGVNDRPAEAAELAQLARIAGAFVNLIPLHAGGAGGLRAEHGRGNRRLCPFAPSSRDRGGDTEEPGDRHQRCMRPATGRTAGTAGATSSR